jgi:hypothetical protein
MVRVNDLNRAWRAATKPLYGQSEADGGVLRANVSVVNNASIASIDVERWIKAVRDQLDQHLAPVWGVSADVELAGPGAARPGCWQLVLERRRGDTSVDGEHSEPVRRGLPRATVTVSRSQTTLGSWSTFASHELLEMVVNPKGATVSSPKRLKWLQHPVRLEVCDPCGNKGYRIGPVEMSNFVYPAWFGDPGDQFDHCGRLKRSFAVASDGSITLGRPGHDVTLLPGLCAELSDRSGLGPSR